MPAALRGNLTYILPEEVMYLLSRFKKTGRLDMGSGSVYFHGGNVVHAKATELEGVDAFYSLAMKEEGEFTFYPDEKAPKNTISVPLAELFQEIERRKAEIEEVMKELPPLDTVPAKSTKTPAKEKIEMKKTHWKILILVDGKRNLRQIVNESGIEKSEAMRSIVWLFNEGLIYDPKEKERIIKEGTQKLKVFLKEFGEGPWIEIIKKKLDEGGLSSYLSIAGTDVLVTNKEMDIPPDRLKEWFNSTLQELKNKAEELLGKIIVKKKWKAIDGAR